MAGFEAQKGGVPFPRSEGEWMQKVNPDTGAPFTHAEASHKVAKDVFGHDYQAGKDGKPIERGKGSALQPTAQHTNALMISQEAEISRKMRLGWHPGMETAFDPRSAPAARRRKQKRKTAPAPAEGNA